MNFFHTNIKSLRGKCGKTQGQVADDLIISQKTIASYEEGRAYPKYDRLIIIADYFNVTIDDLLKTEL